MIENKDLSVYFDTLLYVFKYKGIIRKLILDYKFEEKSFLYKTFVNFLLKDKKFFEILKTYDTIIPVPISKKRKKERGYNQSALIAEDLGKKLHLKIVKNELVKIKDIKKQSTLNGEERKINVQGAYGLRHRYNLENKKILLVDDIYTTGSTVNECAKTLRKIKINKVDVLTIAKD